MLTNLNNVDFGLHRVPAKHFLKKNDPKEEALAILKAKGPVTQQKVQGVDLKFTLSIKSLKS